VNLDRLTGRPAAKYISDEYFEFKSMIHDRLLNLLDLSLIDKLDRETLNAQIRQVVDKILREESFSLPLLAPWNPFLRIRPSLTFW
jgi:hypothetical protein